MFETGRSGSFGNKMNSSVVVSDDRRLGDVLWVGKVLLQFMIKVGKSIESQGYALLQYLNVTGPVDAVDETPGCDGLRWSTKDEVDHILRRGASISRRRGLILADWFVMLRLEAVQVHVNVLTAKHEIAPF